MGKPRISFAGPFSEKKPGDCIISNARWYGVFSSFKVLYSFMRQPLVGTSPKALLEIHTNFCLTMQLTRISSIHICVIVRACCYYFIPVCYEALNYVHYALQQWICKHHIHWLCVNVRIIWLIEKAVEHWISIERLSCSQPEPSIWGREERNYFQSH